MSENLPISAPDRKRAMRWLHEIENLLSPRGFLDAITAARAAGDEALATVLDESRVAQDLRSFGRLEPYETEVISAEATLFRGAPGQAGRRLLVGLTGRGHSLLLPTPNILQRFPADQWDVLLLRDYRLTHFREGCDGFGTSFAELGQAILEFGRPYASISAFGTSMGGMPAIQLGLLSDAIRAVGVCPRRPSDVDRLFKRAHVPSAYEPVCACLAERKRTNLLLVYAEDHGVDRQEAEDAAALTGGTLVPIANAGRHAIMAELWFDGRLEPFLSTVFSSAAFSREVLDEAMSLTRKDVTRYRINRIKRFFSSRIVYRLKKYGLVAAKP